MGLSAENTARNNQEELTVTRTIRKLFAKILTAGAIAAPFALPAVAHAQPAPAARPEAPAKREMSSKELHQHLAHGAGWVRIFDGNGGVLNGTCWILDAEKRLMVTNHHVVDGHDTVTVTFPVWKDGKLVTSEAAYKDAPRVKAVVIDRDRRRDLALIQVESIPTGMHALPLAAEEPDEGDDVRIIGGYTAGGDGLVWGSVKGTVRASGPQEVDLDERRRAVPLREVLSDAATNGGNSGAPVVNSFGEVVAVHFAWKPWAKGVARHVSVVELKAYLKDSLPLVEPKAGAEFLARAKRRLDAGRVDVAASDASAAIAKEAKLAEAYHVRGRVFLAKNDAATALDDLNEALKLEPQNYDFRVSRGRAHRALGKNAEAVTDFSAAIRTDPAKSSGYNERGLTHFFAKKFADAEKDFGRAIDADPRDEVLWGNRADAREQQGKLKEAVADYLQAGKLAPWEPRYPNRAGLICLREGKFDAAAEAFGDAVDASGGLPLYWGNMAVAFERGGKFEPAVKAYTKAIEKWTEFAGRKVQLNPADVASDYAGRGSARIALKQYKEAVDDLTKAIELTDRKVAGYFAERAVAFDGLGEKGPAAADRETAEKLGYKVAKPAVNANANLKPAPAPVAAPAAQGKQPAALVGTWAGGYTRGADKMAQVIMLNADGTFEGAIGVSGPSGTKEIADTGTWSATADQITLVGKTTGKVVRNYKWVGNNVEVELQELGIKFQFGKVK